MNRIALGTVQFGMTYGIANQGGQVSLNEARAILEFAKAHTMDTLDTAIAYGDSEQRLGEIGIAGWQVITKLPELPENCPDISSWVHSSVRSSIERLRIPHLRGLLLHKPGQLLTNQGDELYGALLSLKKDGLVEKIGVSIYEPSELDVYCPRYQFDIFQAPFNILDHRLIDTGWMSRLAERKIELHVRSVFLQGLLLMKPDVRPLKFSRWASLWSKWDEWLHYSGLTPLHACIRYALSFKEIKKVIVGIDSLYQLEEILKAAEGSILYIPDEMQTDDLDLLNPARWTLLQ